MSKLNSAALMSIQNEGVAEFAAPRSKLRANCPVCDSQKSARRFTIPDFLHGVPGTYTYVECRDCGTVYQNPQVIEADLGLCYPKTYFTHSIPEEAEHSPCSSSSWRGRIRSAVLARADARCSDGGSIAVDVIAGLLATIPSVRRRARFGLIDALGRQDRERRCLDIGCGNGTMLRCLTWLGWDSVGLEVDESAAESSRRVSGCEVRTGTLEIAGFRNGEFDMIHMSHVLEHMPDVRTSLELCSKLLRPNGRLILKYPNPKSLVARASGEFAVTWDPPRHLALPPRSAISGLLERAGFRKIDATTSSQCAAIYRAVSRRYRQGFRCGGFKGSVNTADRLVRMVEGLLVFCGRSVGEEIVVVAQKS